MTITDSLINRLANTRNRLARFYDNGGKTADRYHAVYLLPNESLGKTWFGHVGMSANPFHPQGVGMHGHTNGAPLDHCAVVSVGRYNFLGRRVSFTDLPTDCQRLVMRDLREMLQ